MAADGTERKAAAAGGAAAETVTFESFGLDDRLLRAISELGWQKPTLIQGTWRHALLCCVVRVCLRCHRSFRFFVPRQHITVLLIPRGHTEKGIPLALAGKDILSRARTGSGKTATYAIPILQKILSLPKVRDLPGAVSELSCSKSAGS